MTHVSKLKIEKNIDFELDEILRNTFSDIPLNDTLHILSSIFTKTELKMIKKRLGYFYLKDKGLIQDEIAEALKITRQTISRFSMQNKLASVNDTKILFKKIHTSRLSSKLIEIIKELGKVDISRSSMRRKISPF